MTLPSDASPDSLSAWDRLRQGARNVAGVRYQIAVTAHLLASARAGEFEAMHLIPEGLEDVDVTLSDGATVHAQCKDRAGGFGRFQAGDLADAIAHASRNVPRNARIALITDAQLGSGLRATGWMVPVTHVVDDEVLHRLRVALRDRETDVAELERTHIVRLGYGIGDHTVSMLADCFDVSPSVARLLYRWLIDDLLAASAEQRSRPAEQPVLRRPGDLDVLYQHLMELVDFDALHRAVRDGLCEPIDYLAPSDVSRARFLAGVDATPAHIAAGHDVIREEHLADIYDGLSQDRYTLLVGPSGSGKSSLLWRSARDVGWGARSFRIRRVRDESSVDEVVRFVRLQDPSEAAPVLVVGDDLGIPAMELWGELAQTTPRSGPRADPWGGPGASTSTLFWCVGEHTSSI